MKKDKKTILAILHRGNGDMGKIGRMLKDKGYNIDVRCIVAGDSLPNPEEYKGVIIFGGLMSANDTEAIPAIAEETHWISTVIAASTPYLGICLGAQLLAKSMGAGVSRKADKSVEIGFHVVRPTRQHCDFLPKEGLRFYQWHLEGFTIPENCERLAESDHFPNQAFALNEKTIGLQFHPEATRAMIDFWVHREPQHLSLAGAQSYKTQIELFREYDDSVSDWLDELLTKWLS